MTKKGIPTVTAISSKTKKRNKQAAVNDPKNALSKNQLREKLQAKIQDMEERRKIQGDGTKRKRGEKRARTTDTSAVEFANVVSSAKDLKSNYENEVANPSSKKRRIENEIRNIERKKEKINRIGSVAERTEIQHSSRMEDALKRAQGSKIRDDIPKLKKTLKSKEKKKGKGKEAWEGRVQDVKQKNADRQTKRKT